MTDIQPTKAALEAARDLNAYTHPGVFAASGQSNSPMYVDGVLVSKGGTSIYDAGLPDPWAEIALLYGATPDQAAGFAEAMRNQDMSPKAELRWRLNTQLRGEDPGQPNNWPGERGMR